MKIATHNGGFHADEIFAVAILKLIYPRLKVIRTRDGKELERADMRIDVGRRYNPKTNDFDHHQQGGAGRRKNSIPYASAGLIWKHFGMNLVSSEEVFKDIDERIIQYIDANDNGIDTYKVEKVKPYTIAELIRGLNPCWPKLNEKLYDKYFKETIPFAVRILKRELEAAEGIADAEKIIREKIKQTKGNYLVLEEYLPWKKVVIEESNLKYVILHDPVEEHWCTIAVPISLNSFKNRGKLPKKWAGLAGEDLQKVTGVKDAVFCHNKLFIAVAKSKEGAIKLTELALESKE